MEHKDFWLPLPERQVGAIVGFVSEDAVLDAWIRGLTVIGTPWGAMLFR